MEGSLQEVELRHPHKAKRQKFNPFDSAVNLADDFSMDDASDLSSQLGKKVGEFATRRENILFVCMKLEKLAAETHHIRNSPNFTRKGGERKIQVKVVFFI